MTKIVVNGSQQITFHMNATGIKTAFVSVYSVIFFSLFRVLVIYPIS